MGHRVPGCIQCQKFYGCANFDDVTCGQPDIHAWDTVTGIFVGQKFRPGRGNHLAITTCMIAMFVGVDNLGDGPAIFLSARQTFLVIKRMLCPYCPATASRRSA